MEIAVRKAFINANYGDGSLATNRFDPIYKAVYVYDGRTAIITDAKHKLPGSDINEDPASQMYGFDNIQAGQGFFVLAIQQWGFIPF